MEVSPQYLRPRTFRKNSKLFKFLVKKKSTLVKSTKSSYRLSTVQLAVAEIIVREKLYDPLNPQVIVCDKELEEALDVSCLQRSQLGSFIERHFRFLTGFEPMSSLRLYLKDLHLLVQLYDSIEQPKTGPVPQTNFDIEGHYQLKPEFIKVIRTVRKMRKNQTVLSYRDICYATSEYIMGHKCEFFDLRNITILNLKGDQMGVAFGVNFLSRPQITSYIRGQLITLKRSERLKK